MFFPLRVGRLFQWSDRESKEGEAGVDGEEHSDRQDEEHDGNH